MKFCQGLKDDRLYEKNTEMDPRGWEEAKTIIRKHTAAAYLKEDLAWSTKQEARDMWSIASQGNKQVSQAVAGTEEEIQ